MNPEISLLAGTGNGVSGSVDRNYWGAGYSFNTGQNGIGHILMVFDSSKTPTPPNQKNKDKLAPSQVGLRVVITPTPANWH